MRMKIYMINHLKKSPYSPFAVEERGCGGEAL
jgi:hypothetical protein